MQTREHSSDGLQILSIDGEIDLASSPELRAVLGVHSKAKCPLLVLDFAAVTYVDSSGLATLIEYVRNAQSFNGRFALVEVSQRVQTIFDLVRLREFLPIYSTLAEARVDLLHPPGA